jgi:hypothetical protein
MSVSSFSVPRYLMRPIGTESKTPTEWRVLRSTIPLLRTASLLYTRDSGQSTRSFASLLTFSLTLSPSFVSLLTFTPTPHHCSARPEQYPTTPEPRFNQVPSVPSAPFSLPRMLNFCYRSLRFRPVFGPFFGPFLPQKFLQQFLQQNLQQSPVWPTVERFFRGRALLQVCCRNSPFVAGSFIGNIGGIVNSLTT